MEHREDSGSVDDSQHSDSMPDDHADDSQALSGKVKRTASRVAEGVSSVVKQALVARDHVLMVRINDEALNRINDLKDAGLFRSRSEAAAYLIAEGIEAKHELFDRIGERILQIQNIKDELRTLAGEAGVEASSETDDQ